ncbi:MAG TPA: hypothetical protein VH643_12390 [Gemmataceae bacterium]|jgi:hypothetical protein
MKKLLVLFAVGGLIGLITGCPPADTKKPTVTTKPADDLKSKIKEGAEKVKEGTKEGAEKVKEGTKEAVKQGAEKVKEGAEKVKESVEKKDNK